MSDICPVVRIADENAPGGFVEINESDFDPKTHQLYAEGANDGAGEDADALRAQIERLGGKAHHKAGVEKLQSILDGLLDAKHDDAGGKSIRELNADLESLGIEIDPADSPADKAAKIAAALEA